MRRLHRFRLLGIAAVLGALIAVTGGLVISQAAGGQSAIQATVYDDAVRFTVQNEKVEIMRAEVFNLGGKRLFDSGPTMGNALDWAMITESGERVAHGVYLYVITAWDSGGELLKSQVGKLALVPGGVGLGQAPALISESEEATATESSDEQVRALGYDHTGDYTISGKLGVGTDTPSYRLHVVETTKGAPSPLFENANGASLMTVRNSGSIASIRAAVLFQKSTSNLWEFGVDRNTDGTRNFFIWDVAGGTTPFLLEPGAPTDSFRVNSLGNVGIGTNNPSASLEVHGSASNLLALYDPVAPTDAKFRVEKDGDVRADGAYYSGTGGYYTGSADVAERINTSEWVEQGNVVEIDPEHPGFFRKTRSSYSTNVAGVISTSPGVVLGNNFDAEADKWEDNRPMLALAGRVPVKVTAENGPIQVGDLLISSSIPGYAMRCSDRAACVGATIGKALEPLEKGTGTIMVQVILR